MVPDDDKGGGLAALALVASAIAGRKMQLAPAAAGNRSWCDGTTIFLELEANPVRQVQMLAVQASLVAGRSLDPSLLAQLARRPALTRRYLAMEVHRALMENERVLPAAVCSLIDPLLAGAFVTPEESLAWARRGEAVADPPESSEPLNQDVPFSPWSVTASVRTDVLRRLRVRQRGAARYPREMISRTTRATSAIYSRARSGVAGSWVACWRNCLHRLGDEEGAGPLEPTYQPTRRQPRTRPGRLGFKAAAPETLRRL